MQEPQGVTYDTEEKAELLVDHLQTVQENTFDDDSDEELEELVEEAMQLLSSAEREELVPANGLLSH